MVSRLLVVEDDPDVRDSVVDILALEVPDLGVATAANGQEALDLLSAGLKPCLILLDILMPVMDGFEFLKALATLQPRPPISIIILSAHLKAPSTTAYPVTRLLPKPYTAEALVDAVKQYCV
jgi:CheY-like chemotaxis protein